MKQQEGMVLVSVLLFLFVFSLLITANLELHLLENKMSGNNYNKIISFEGAEAGLMAAEAKIQSKPFSLSFLKASVNYRIQLINTDSCGKKRYRIIANASYHHSTVSLMSEYERLLSAVKPVCKKELINRRTYWKETRHFGMNAGIQT